MAIRVTKWQATKATLGTTVTRLHAGDGVRTVWVVALDDILLSYDNSKSDGGTISATNQDRIPAGMKFPIQIGRGAQRPVVCSVTGSVVAHFSGEP